MDELQAGVLRYRLPHVDSWNARRREIVRAYGDAANERVHVLDAPDPEHVAHLAVVVVDDAADLSAHLRRFEVASDVHYPVPDHLQPAFAGLAARTLPATESLVGRVLSLPCFPELTDVEIEQVQDAIHRY